MPHWNEELFEEHPDLFEGLFEALTHTTRSYRIELQPQIESYREVVTLHDEKTAFRRH